MYKRSILLPTLFLYSFVLAGQLDDHRFLTSATTWIDCIGYDVNDVYQISGISLEYYIVTGDTLINDKPYYRLCRTRVYKPYIYFFMDEQGNDQIRDRKMEVFNDDLHFFMREDENGDVWLYIDEESTFEEISQNVIYEFLADKLVCRELFLFNVKKSYTVGDKQPLGTIAWECPDPEPNWWEGELWCIDSLEVMEVNDNIMHDGKRHRTYTYGIYYNGEKFLGERFVQGIGPLKAGPLGRIGSPSTGKRRILLAFYQDNQLIYEDEGYVSAIEKYFPDILDELRGKKPENNISHIPILADHESLYDLSGRRLQQKPTKGIYIQNGKKLLVK